MATSTSSALPQSTSDSSSNQSPEHLTKTVLEWLIFVLAFASVAAVVTTRFRRLRRTNRFPTSSFPLSSRSTPASILPSPYLAETQYSSSHPPHPAVAHTRTDGRTVRALDTDDGGRRGGAAGDYDVEYKDALPAYEGFKGGPPKYDERGP